MNKSKLLLCIYTLCTAVLFVQCSLADNRNNSAKAFSSNFVDVNLNGTYLGVIMPSELLPAILPQCSRSTPNESIDTWVVSLKEVLLLESEFTKFVEKKGIVIPNGGLANYYRQYLGIVINGSRFIYVNGYHKSYYSSREKHIQKAHVKKKMMDNLKAHLSKLVPTKELDVVLTNIHYWPANVCEGGDRYFGALYDIEQATFTQFKFSHGMNGVRPGYDSQHN